MTSKDTQSNVKEQLKNKLRILKSDFFLEKLFGFLSKRKSLKTIKYNKYVQKRMNINVNTYKMYSETYTPIELEIIPKKKDYGPFINIKKEDKEYYHIFLMIIIMKKLKELK